MVQISMKLLPPHNHAAHGHITCMLAPKSRAVELMGRRGRAVRGESRRGWTEGTSGQQGGSWRKTIASTRRPRARAVAKRGCRTAHNQAGALPKGQEDGKTHASWCVRHRQGGGGHSRCTPRCARDANDDAHLTKVFSRYRASLFRKNLAT